jgi:hypothetical protein
MDGKNSFPSGGTFEINNLGESSGTATWRNNWNLPIRIEVNEVGDSIEMIYKETSMITYTTYPSPLPEERVFKIIYSCIGGKWNKSEPIYGKIISPKNESYEF